MSAVALRVPANSFELVEVQAPPPPILRAVESHEPRDFPGPRDSPRAPDTNVARTPLRASLSETTIGKIAIFAFEAVEGTRSVGQLGRWISYNVSQELSQYRALTIERRSLYRDSRRLVPSVLRVRTSQPTRRAIEATVLVDVSGRCRAIALRFEQTRNRWQATSITIL